MVTAISGKYPRTRKALEKSMKIVQRELEDGKLKVDFLTILLDLRDKLDNGEKED